MYAALVPVALGIDLPGFDLLMPQKEFTVGRGEHNDIVIRGPHISYAAWPCFVAGHDRLICTSTIGYEHCKLVWNADKKIMYVQWLPTTNGTWVRCWLRITLIYSDVDSRS